MAAVTTTTPDVCAVKPRLARAPAAPAPVPATAVARPTARPATPADALAGRLAHVVAHRAGGAVLQRMATERATTMRTRAGGNRLGNVTPEVEFARIRDLRTQHAYDSSRILADLRYDHLSGSSDSDVTGDAEENYRVRIDRQNPLPEGQNLQIQTNGNSISIATVLISDAVLAGGEAQQRHVLRVVRRAFLGSLADGMQWEVVDAPAPVTVKSGKGGHGKQRGGPKGPGGKKGGSGSATGGTRALTVH